MKIWFTRIRPGRRKFGKILMGEHPIRFKGPDSYPLPHGKIHTAANNSSYSGFCCAEGLDIEFIHA